MVDYANRTLMNEATLAAASTVPSTIAGTECAVMDLTDVDDLALTVECEFATAATGNAVFKVFTSPTGAPTDATVWDTEEFAYGTLTCVAAARVQKTIVIEGDPKFAKVQVENEDATKAIYDVKIKKVTTT